MKLITLFSLFVVLLSYLIRARFMEVFMNKNFGSGYEQSDLSGEIIDTDLTTEDLVAIAQDQIAVNETILVQIRQGQAELDKIEHEMFMQWVQDTYNETIHPDDMVEASDDLGDDYAQWLIETEMPVE